MQIDIEINRKEFEAIAESCPFAFINENYEERWCKPLAECAMDNCPFIHWIENILRRR